MNGQVFSPLWWLWLPLAFLIAQAGLEVSFSSQTLARLHSEGGPHEFIQVILLVGALAVAVLGALQTDWKTRAWVGVWFSLAALCSFYVGGEEISWGQHILKWTTPEFWSAVNDQNETNLHNTSSWLDQKPRLVLEVGIYVGGILIPLLQKYRPRFLPSKFSVIYPSKELAAIALLVLLPKMAEAVAEMFDFKLFERVSEVQELYMYAFVFLYLISLRKKIRVA